MNPGVEKSRGISLLPPGPGVEFSQFRRAEDNPRFIEEGLGRP